MRRSFLIALAGLLMVCGCAHGKKKTLAPTFLTPNVSSGSNQKLILTPDTALVGKVVRVNAAARFAIVSFPIGHLPALDQRLSVYRLGLKTGEIKVTGPQLDDKVVGDVTAGDVQTGDEVRDR